MLHSRATHLHLKRVGIAALLGGILLFGGSASHADNAKTHFDKAMSLYKEKQNDAALQELDAARKLAPNDETILNWIGWINLAQGKYREAQEPLEHAVKEHPNAVDAHLNLGNVYDGLKMYPQAVLEFETVIHLKPQSADAYYNLGSVYYKMQRNADAVNAYRHATQLKPDDPYNWNGLGYVYQSMGRYTEAMEAYEKATRLDPDKPESATFWLNYSLAALSAAGKARELPGGTAKAKADEDYSHARTALEKAVKLSPNSYQVRETYAETLFDLSKYDEAIPEFEKAAQLAPGKPFDSYYNLGLTYEKLGKSANAAEAYKRAAEADPENHNALFRLGEMQFKQGHYDEAAKTFTQVTKADPSDLNGWINLASSLHMQGDAESETTVLEEAVKHNGDSTKMARLHCALAYRYYQKGTEPGATAGPDLLKRASDQYNDALKAVPNMPDALNGLGLIALHNNNLDEALKDFKQATVAKPDFADAFNNIGVVYKTRGDREQARTYYKKALQIDPNNKLAKENLTNLDRRPK